MHIGSAWRVVLAPILLVLLATCSLSPVTRSVTVSLPDSTRSVLQRHDLVHGQYLLAVGTLEPRKNLQLVLRAYRSLPAALRARHPLVVVGMKGFKNRPMW